MLLTKPSGWYSALWLVAAITATVYPIAAMGEEAVADDLGIDLQQLARIDPLVEAAIARGDLPGCVVAIGRRDGVAWLRAFGERSVEPKSELMTTDTVFDLASLTKPIATATSVMRLVEQGKLRLQSKAVEFLPEFGANGKEMVTIEQLLLHTAGFVPDNPLRDYQQGHAEAWRHIDALTPQTPPGEAFVYSDVGFITLGRIVEKVSGKPLDQFAAGQIYRPLGMDETGYNPTQEMVSRIAPTTKENGKWRRGNVHDPRAALLEGVAGHAGLFSTAGDLSRYARMMLSGGELDGVRVLSQKAVNEMTRPRDIKGDKRGLGWDVRTGYSRNRGELMTDAAFGHGGFTGTGIWIDPGLDLFVVFLSSRLHPDGEGNVNDLIGRIGTIAVAAARDAPSNAN